MRLFVAVEIDPHVVRRIADCSDELRRRAQATAPRARIGWVPADRLHVTVRFIGEAPDPQAERIVSSLAEPLGVEPFDALFEGAGAFPERGAPRVLWVGITRGLEGFGALERVTTRRLASCGVEPEERPYHPHVTLARVREASGLRTRTLLDGLEHRSFGTSAVKAITLFQSRSSPGGSIYVPLQSATLRVSASHS